MAGRKAVPKRPSPAVLAPPTPGCREVEAQRQGSHCGEGCPGRQPPPARHPCPARSLSEELGCPTACTFNFRMQRVTQALPVCKGVMQRDG